jgi:bifunctional non-homologous end joining protein LigD
VVQVEFAEWTSDAILRHPSYLGTRDDKAPTAVVREG